MSPTPKLDLLIATWTHTQDPTTDPPNHVIWGNRTAATYEEYLDHLSDTHTWVVGRNGTELHIFPYIVGDVRYDNIAGTWMLGGVGPTCVALDLIDPSASEDEITAALYTHVVVYRARIHR